MYMYTCMCKKREYKNWLKETQSDICIIHSWPTVMHMFDRKQETSTVNGV